VEEQYHRRPGKEEGNLIETEKIEGDYSRPDYGR
jgi:hypothetical protein